MSEKKSNYQVVRIRNTQMPVEPEGHIHHIYTRDMNAGCIAIKKYGASTTVLATYNLFTKEGLDKFLEIAEPYKEYEDDITVAFSYALYAQKMLNNKTQ